MSLLYLATAADREQSAVIVQAVLYWTGGHPFLTQWLCQECVKRGCRTEKDVERLVTRVCPSLNALRSDPHFQEIIRFLGKRTADQITTLELYRRIWLGRQEPDKTTLIHAQLKLTGLVKRDQQGYLVVRNRIYERIFTVEWAEQAMQSVLSVEQQMAVKLKKTYDEEAKELKGINDILLPTVRRVPVERRIPTTWRVRQEVLTFISIDWLKPLAARLKKIRDERTEEIRKISDTFGDLQLLAHYYIEPNCQHHNPADHGEDEVPISYVKTPVFMTINEFLNKEIDDSLRDGRTQLFILADAGMGKTSLLVMLKLAHILAFWPKGYDCLLLKLGPDTLEAISKQANKANTILLLDALDEDPTAWGRFEERLIELLLETKNFRRVLITCRTQFFPETGADPFGNPGRVTVSGFICPMLFLSLFDDRQVTDYLRKRFPDPWHYGLTGRENERRRRAEQLLNSMHSLRSRPLLLAHIDLLEDKAQQWNEYTTYEALIEAWLLREVRKLASQGVKPLPSKDDLWVACTAVAVQMQSRGQRTLSRADLQELVTAMPAIANIERFDFGGRSLLNRTSGSTFRFSHHSIQDFLVVHALVEGGLEAVKAACPKTTQPLKIRATVQMLNFLRCRLSESELSKFLKQLDLSDIEPNSTL